MANFDVAYNIVAGHEGGYQNNPADVGNFNSNGELVGTNWGIAAFTYEAWLGFPPSASDMMNMTQQEARQIYKANFWDDIQGDNILNQSVANIFFDGRVNHGKTGTRLMQEVLGLVQDGIVGPITLGTINTTDSHLLYNAYKERRIDFYHQLVNNNPTFSVFLNGWLSRINSFNDFPTAQGQSSSLLPLAFFSFIGFLIFR